MRRIVLLVSGGLDSTTSWWHLSARRWDVLPLFVDYGQPAAEQEWRAVELLCHEASRAATRLHVRGEIYPEHPAFGLLPARNLVLLSLAVAHALSRGVRVVGIGSNADDAQRADGTRAFRNLVTQAARSTSPSVRILAPLAGLSKVEVVARARELVAPIQATVSCYFGVGGGCGDCRGCHDRRRALSWLDPQP